MEWADRNGLQINSKKSGILQICPRMSAPTITARSVAGIPVVSSYKYLGIHLNNKLSLDHHIGKIKPKIRYLAWRLAIYPKKICSM
jgi:hypothetical protein